MLHTPRHSIPADDIEIVINVPSSAGTKRKFTEEPEVATPPTPVSMPATPSPQQQPTIMQGVSIEVLQMIFSFMHPSPVTLCRLSCVSKIFHLAADSHPLWRVMAQKAGLSLPAEVVASTGHKRARTQKKPDTWKSLVASKFKTICIHCCKINSRSLLQHIHDWNENAKRPVCIETCFQPVWNQYLVSHPYANENSTAAKGRGSLTKGRASSEYQIPTFALNILPHATEMNPYSPMGAPMRLYKRHCLERMRDFLYGGDQGLQEYLRAKEKKAIERAVVAEEKRANRKEKVNEALQRKGISVNGLDKHPDYGEIFDSYIRNGRDSMFYLVEKFILCHSRRIAIEQFCDEISFGKGKYIPEVKGFLLNGDGDLEQVKEFIRYKKQLQNLVGHSDQAQESAEKFAVKYDGEFSNFANGFTKKGTNWTRLNLWAKLQVFRASQRNQREELMKTLISEEHRVKFAEKLEVYKRFVYHGIGTAEQVVNAVERERSVPQNLDRQQRKRLLRGRLNRLSESDIHRCMDDNDCYSIIKGYGWQTLEGAVEAVEQMHWLMSNEGIRDGFGYYHDSDYNESDDEDFLRRIGTIQQFVDDSIKARNYDMETRDIPESLWPYLKKAFGRHLRYEVPTIEREFAKENPNGSLQQFWEFADSRGGVGLSELIRKIIDIEAFDPATDYGDLMGNLSRLLSLQEKVDVPYIW